MSQLFSRPAPQSESAEKGLLCSILLSPELLGKCIENITDDWFYMPQNRLIYSEMVRLWQSSKPIDFTTLTQSLNDKKKLQDAGGPAYISELFTFIPTSQNSEAYLELLKEKYTARLAIAGAVEIITAAHGDEESTLSDSIQSVLTRIASVAETKSSIHTSKECSKDALTRYESARKSGGAITGLLTGIPRLDYLLRGLRGGQMIVISAKQKHGKSALGWQIVDFCAIRSANPIAVGACSLEMGRAEITDRRHACEGSIDLSKLDEGSFSVLDVDKITKAAAKVGNSKVYIKDEAGVNILQIRATLRRMVHEYGIKLALIDYLQIIQAVNRKDSRERQVAEISQNIKQAAKELDIPIIILVQLNKQGDARESAAIEMDCDKFIVIESEDEEDFEENESPEMSLRVKYNRAGPCGRVKVRFLKRYTRFEPL